MKMKITIGSSIINNTVFEEVSKTCSVLHSLHMTGCFLIWALKICFHLKLVKHLSHFCTSDTLSYLILP